MKLREIKWARHVALTQGGEIHTKFWWGNIKGLEQVKDLGVDEKLLLKCVLKKEVVRGGGGLDLSVSGWGQVAGSGTYGCTKCEAFLE
jgi:hypothetical protein